MPTPKQVRFHWGRISKLYWKLQHALDVAHREDVIVYDSEKFRELAPCYSMGELWERLLATTEKQLARAMRDEIEKEGRQ